MLSTLVLFSDDLDCRGIRDHLKFARQILSKVAFLVAFLVELPDPLFCLAALGVLLAKNGFVTYNVLFGGRFLAPEVESCATAAANQGLPSQSLSFLFGLFDELSPGPSS